MIEWQQNRLITGTVIAVFLVVQIVVPVSRLSGERGARFGWQMYSAVRSSPELEVSTAEDTIPIDLRDYVVSPRLDVDITGHLPRHLCTVIPGAIEVSWEDGSYRC